MIPAGQSNFVKQYSSQPSSTLAFIEHDDPQFQSITERERKVEKSVHFATEELAESVSEGEPSEADSLQTSQDVISWLPSEHLYEDDTFLSETTTLQKSEIKGGSDEATSTGQTYGTNTFVDLDSEEETRTASEFSETEGLSSSDIFSTHSRETSSITYREWRDVTEIVKDIEELEESEFVTRADTDHLEELASDEAKSGEDTDVSDTMEAEFARDQFIQAQLRRLRLGLVSSPRTLTFDPSSPRMHHSPRAKGPEDKAKAVFCKKLIHLCKNKKADQSRRVASSDLDLQQRTQMSERSDVQSYGLNPAVVDRLKMANLQLGLRNKLSQLDKDIESSEHFVERHGHLEEERARQKFVQSIQRLTRGDNMDDVIQAHLIKMHPVRWFGDFVRGMPKPSADSWDVLYHYKTQLERRKEGDS